MFGIDSKRTWNRLNRRGIVLTYHRVVDLVCDPWQLGVSPVRFEEHLQVINKYGKPVQLREMGMKLKRFSIGKMEIVVSFDDGYADNVYNAKPILERHNVPATFFIVSGAVDSREELWWDELEKILLQSESLPQVFDLSIAGTDYDWQITSEKGRETLKYEEGIRHVPEANAVLSSGRLYFALWKILSELSSPVKQDTLRQIAQWAKSTMSRTTHLAMTSKELLSLARSPLFEIGAHTVSHPMLSRLPLEKQKEEIVCSKDKLERLIGEPVTSFAYPHGDYSDDTLRLLRQSNFKNACTVHQGPVFRNADPLLMPRFTVLNWNTDTFEQNLCRWLTQTA